MTKRSGRNPSRERGREVIDEREVQSGRRGRHEGDGEVGLSSAERGSKAGDKGSQRDKGSQPPGEQQQGERQKEGQRKGQERGTESTRPGTGGQERKPAEEGRDFEEQGIREKDPGKGRNR